MPSLIAVQRALPPFRNEKVLLMDKQGTKDIEDEIVHTHGLYETDYDKIWQLFDTGNINQTCYDIWAFLRYNLTYKEESGEEQSVKSPSAILHRGEAIDCKHYALFAGGVLDAIKANTGDNFTWCFRFVTNKRNGAGRYEATHVFTVVFDQGREIWIDPCFETFDYHKDWKFTLDKAPMSLVRISGPGDQEQTNESTPVAVNKQQAWASFLYMAQHNLFGAKALLLQNPNVTNTALKNYCVANGFDFDQLLRFLAA